MSAWETYPVPLTDGRTLLSIQNEDRGFLKLIEILPDGRARIWQQTWADSYKPTDRIYPGFISAARSILEVYR